MLNPCFDLCYLRYNKQYSPEKCDDTCQFASIVKQNKALIQELNELKEKLKNAENLAN